MENIFTVWLICFAAIMLVYARTSYRLGPGIAMGVAMSLTLLVPTWIFVKIIDIPFDLRSSIAIATLLAFVCDPRASIRSPLIPLDLIVASMVTTHLVSDAYHDGFSIAVLVQAEGEWLLPYLTARFALLQRDSVKHLSPWFVSVACVLGFLGFWESLSDTNVWEACLAPMDDLVARQHGMRYDFLYRACGPTRHPIFFGVVLLLLLPWGIALTRSTRNRRLGWAGVLLTLLGILSTVSRGPILGLATAGICALAIARPIVRKPLAVVALLGAVVVAANWSTVTNMVASTETNDPSRAYNSVVTVDGTPELYNGTHHRIYIWRIYAPLILRGGPIGFGTAAIQSFPPNIPGLPPSAVAREKLGIVDNSYLLVGLRFGWLGLMLLCGLLSVAFFTAVTLRRSSGLILYPDGPELLTAFAGSFSAVALVIATVYFSYDFAFWIIFHTGVVAGLHSLRKKMIEY